MILFSFDFQLNIWKRVRIYLHTFFKTPVPESPFDKLFSVQQPATLKKETTASGFIRFSDANTFPRKIFWFLTEKSPNC